MTESKPATQARGPTPWVSTWRLVCVFFLLAMWSLAGLLLYQLPNHPAAETLAVTGILGGALLFVLGLIGGTSLRFSAMKIGQIVFWVGVAVIYAVFSFYHCRQLGAHLDPIPEIEAEGSIYGVVDDQQVGVWEPLRDAILTTNTRISQLNANNDTTNRVAAFSYGFAAVIALFCACFTWRESRSR